MDMVTEETLSASPHKVSPLVRCELPHNVKSLRSWLGAARFLKQLYSNFSGVLSPLENFAANKESSDTLSWTNELIDCFHAAQKFIASPSTIHIPLPSDSLIIMIDAAVKNPGIGAVLFIKRININKHLLGGYFSSKLTKHKEKWLVF